LLLVRNRLATGFALALTCTTGQIDIRVTGSAGTGEFAILDRPFIGISNLPVAPTPNIIPAGPVGLYALRDVSAGTFRLYTHFPAFSGAVNQAVSLGAEVRHVSAIGAWDAVTSSISSGLISIVVE
jgi:hypothetical protein